MIVYSALDDIFYSKAVVEPKLKFKNKAFPNSSLNSLTAIHPKKGPVGSLEYYKKPTELEIQLLRVPSEHRGNGYGNHLMDELQRQNPGIPINHGERTDLGQSWWDSYSRGKDVQNGRTMASLNLYHRTTPEAAEAIYQGSPIKSKENTGETYWTTDPHSDSQATGYGSALVHIRIPEEIAELDDEFPSGERHYRVHPKNLRPEHFVRHKEGNVVDFSEYERMPTKEAMFIEAVEDKSPDAPPTSESAMNPQQQQKTVPDPSDKDELSTEGSHLTYKPFLNVFEQQ